MKGSTPARGEVWLVDFDPTRGHEQAGLRPGLVVSDSLFNQGPADLVIVLPITTTARGIPTHVRIDPPEGGLRRVSFVLSEHVRSISKERLVEPWGLVSAGTLVQIEDRLRLLLML